MAASRWSSAWIHAALPCTSANEGGLKDVAGEKGSDETGAPGEFRGGRNVTVNGTADRADHQHFGIVVPRVREIPAHLFERGGAVAEQELQPVLSE